MNTSAPDRLFTINEDSFISENNNDSVNTNEVQSSEIIEEEKIMEQNNSPKDHVSEKELGSPKNDLEDPSVPREDTSLTEPTSRLQTENNEPSNQIENVSSTSTDQVEASTGDQEPKTVEENKEDSQHDSIIVSLRKTIFRPLSARFKRHTIAGFPSNMNYIPGENPPSPIESYMTTSSRTSFEASLKKQASSDINFNEYESQVDAQPDFSEHEHNDRSNDAEPLNPESHNTNENQDSIAFNLPSKDGSFSSSSSNLNEEVNNQNTDHESLKEPTSVGDFQSPIPMNSSDTINSSNVSVNSGTDFSREVVDSAERPSTGNESEVLHSPETPSLNYTAHSPENPNQSDYSILVEKTPEQTEEEKAALAEKKREKAKIIRREVIKEICKVEQVYNGNLSVLCNVYLQPIQQIQPDPVIDALLCDILDIQQPHNILLKDIIKYTGSEENFPPEKLDTAPIGKIFSEISPYLKIYLNYMSTHSQINVYLSHASKKLSNYLNECIKKPECQQRDFNSYSTMPIQQIPRYEMLIKRLIENTPEDHPDLPFLNKALKEIRNVANKCNQGLADEYDSNITRKIHASLGQLKDLPPSRKLIKHGDLKKKNHYGKVEYCTFFLWNDCLMYANRSPNNRCVYQTGKYRNTIKFRPGITCRSSTREDLMFYIHGWTKNVILIAENENEKNEWVDAICSVIDKVNENFNKGRINEFFLSKTEIQSIFKLITDKTPEELFGSNYEEEEIGKIIRSQVNISGIRKEYKHLAELESQLKQEQDKMNPEELPPIKVMSLLESIRKSQNSLIRSLKLEDYFKQNSISLKDSSLLSNENDKLKIFSHHHLSFTGTSSNSAALFCCKCGSKFGVLNKCYTCPSCGRNFCWDCFSKNPKLTADQFERDLTNRCADCIVQSRELSRSGSKASIGGSELSLHQGSVDFSNTNGQEDPLSATERDSDHIGLITVHSNGNTIVPPVENTNPASPH